MANAYCTKQNRIVLILVIILLLAMFSYKQYQGQTKDTVRSKDLVTPTVQNKIEEILFSLRRTIKQQNGTYIIGKAPISKTWILSQLKPFLSSFDKRISTDNQYGSKIMHQFAIWCMIKYLQPKHVIESGIYRGLGTWNIRQAAGPGSQLILLDPNGASASVYRDQQPDTLYMIGSKFKDFGNVDWKNILNLEKSLVIIDDHQYPIRRLQEARKFGFKHVIFDDNYWVLGDLLSVKTIAGAVYGKVDPKTFTIEDMGHKITNQLNTVETIKSVLSNQVKTYWEFPKIWNCSGQFQCLTNKENSNNLLNVTDADTVLRQYGLKKVPQKDQLSGYYNIAYVNLN